MFQTVSIEIIEKNENMAYVSNLDPNDVLFNEPVKSLNELRKINLLELRQRFLDRKSL
jgi:hypothetical protein